jgi:hypothetical protein
VNFVLSLRRSQRGHRNGVKQPTLFTAPPTLPPPLRCLPLATIRTPAAAHSPVGPRSSWWLAPPKTCSRRLPLRTPGVRRLQNPLTPTSLHLGRDHSRSLCWSPDPPLCRAPRPARLLAPRRRRPHKNPPSSTSSNPTRSRGRRGRTRAHTLPPPLLPPHRAPPPPPHPLPPPVLKLLLRFLLRLALRPRHPLAQLSRFVHLGPRTLRRPNHPL